jgi:hypothetical protein
MIKMTGKVTLKKDKEEKEVEKDRKTQRKRFRSA